MKINRNGLIIRLAVIVIFTAASVGLITTEIYYRFIYLNEVEFSLNKISQLHKTVSSTASIATYLEDENLLQEVINGLNSNDIVATAAIFSNQKQLSSQQHQINKDTIVFDLFSPFEKKRIVGQLSITPNKDYIRQRAENVGYENAIVLAIEVFIVTIITIITASFVITKPILAVARSLHDIQPGNSERISVPTTHNTSELGTLVSDINKLLEKAEQQIFQERSLRVEVELLEKRFRMLFENSTAPIVLMEPQGNILLYNQSFKDLITRLEIVLKKNYGPYLRQLFLDTKALDNTVKYAFNNDETATGEFKLQTKETAATIWVQVVITATVTNDYKEYYQVTLHDISKRKEQLELLNNRANYDQLTQLLNRQAAEIKMQQFIDSEQAFAVILLDLNDFKPVNDIYGHDAGDEILIHAAGQLTASIRKNDILSRWGGDEFVLLLPDVSAVKVEKICRKLQKQISKSFYLAEYETSVSVGASMGVSFFPQDKQSLHSLVKAADLAMYQVKRNKNNSPEIGFCFYEQLDEESRNA